MLLTSKPELGHIRFSAGIVTVAEDFLKNKEKKSYREWFIKC